MRVVGKNLLQKLTCLLLCASVVTCVSSCFTEPSIPECVTLANCPTGQGYTGCLGGYCYKSEVCATRPAVSGDGCCATTEGDRSADLDCLLTDTPLSCTDPAGPSLDDDGNIFVSCLLTEGDGTTSVILRRLDPAGNLSVPVVAGPGNAAFNPVLGIGGTIYVQYATGLVRYLTSSLGVVKRLSDVVPVGPVSSNRGYGTCRSIVGWPGNDGRISLYDEEADVVLAYGPDRSDLGAAGANQLTVSWTGRRMYVTWNTGQLDVWEIGANPLGLVLSMQLPALAAVPALDVDGRIYVVLMDGRLISYKENAALRLDEIWSLDLFQGVPEQKISLLVRPDNSMVVIGQSGKVQIIKDMETFASVVAEGTFDDPLDDTYPVLTASNRVVAVSEDGKIVSMLPEDQFGGLQTGLSFVVPSRPVSDLVLQGNSLVYVSESGNLTAWVYPDGPAEGRWIRRSGDNGSTGRTVRPSVSTGNN